MIGYKFNIDIFKGWFDMDDIGYLIVDFGMFKIKIKGVFVSGDVVDKVYC